MSKYTKKSYGIITLEVKGDCGQYEQFQTFDIANIEQFKKFRETLYKYKTLNKVVRIGYL